MLLRQLLEVLPGTGVPGTSHVEVRSLAYDSRDVRPGALFVSVPSVSKPDRSGARFISEAVSRGACAVVTQEHVDLAAVPVFRVSDARTALADLAAAFYGYPSRSLALFAVTGTDGKTTTTYLLEQILAAAGFNTGLVGSVEVKIGPERTRSANRMTTPEALDVQRALRAMVDTAVTHVALEASSHALTLHRLRGCSFAACAVTNITSDHVEFHGSWDAYFGAKARLFTDLAPDRPAVLNRDMEHYERLRSRIRGTVRTYGLHPDADIRAYALEPLPGGTRCRVEAAGCRTDMVVPMVGVYNVSNALAATGLALAAGISLQAIAQAVSASQLPPGRLQRVDVGQPFTVVVDYAHTVNAFRSVLSALRENAMPGSRIIAVFGAAGDRDRSKRPVLGRLAHEYADFFVITNEDPYGEDPNEIIGQIAAGVPVEKPGARFVVEPDRGRAIELAFSEARPGDTVVILGKGHEQSIVGQGATRHWSDVEAARAALSSVL